MRAANDMRFLPSTLMLAAALSPLAAATKAPPSAAQRSADQLVRKAQASWSKSDFYRAKLDLDAAIGKVPDHAGALAFLCTMTMAQAEMDARAFTTVEAVRMRYRDAAAACGTAADRGVTPPPGMSFLALRARALVGACDWTGAVAAYEAWIAAEPNDGRVAGGYAAMLDRTGRAEGSRTVLALAAARSPAFDHAARFAFVWDRFALDDAENLRPMLATLRQEETDPLRRAVLDTLRNTLDGNAATALLDFMDVVEADVLPRPELDHLWRSIEAHVTDEDRRTPLPGALESGTEGLELPTLIKAVAPKYPVVANRAGAEGKVIVLARINVDGSVHPTWVIKESARAFAQPAEDAVLARRYTPLKRGGKAVPMTYTIRVDFKFR